MNKISWELNGMLRKPVYMAWLACLVSVLVVLAYFSLIVPLRTELKLVQVQYETMQLEASAIMAERHAYIEPSATDRLLPLLPAQSDLPKWLSFIFASAGDLGMTVTVGGYSYEHTKGESYGRYHIDIPLTSDYASIRALIVTWMNGMPFASLDEISFTRASVEAEDIEAHVKMTLNLRDN